MTLSRGKQCALAALVRLGHRRRHAVSPQPRPAAPLHATVEGAAHIGLTRTASHPRGRPSVGNCCNRSKKACRACRPPPPRPIRTRRSREFAAHPSHRFIPAADCSSAGRQSGADRLARFDATADGSAEASTASTASRDAPGRRRRHAGQIGRPLSGQQRSLRRDFRGQSRCPVDARLVADRRRAGDSAAAASRSAGRADGPEDDQPARRTKRRCRGSTSKCREDHAGPPSGRRPLSGRPTSLARRADPADDDALVPVRQSRAAEEQKRLDSLRPE